VYQTTVDLISWASGSGLVGGVTRSVLSSSNLDLIFASFPFFVGSFSNWHTHLVHGQLEDAFERL